MARADDVTRMLEEMSGGNRTIIDRLFPLLYDELGRLARGQLQREREDHTLNTTGLVHEAYLKLVDLDRITWRNRAQFFALAATAMRRILINYARDRKAAKRGGGRRPVPLEEYLFLDEHLLLDEPRLDDLLALDEALDRLATLDERWSRVVECRFFSGMSIPETAEALGVSPVTVSRDWNLARAWLNRELQELAPPPAAPASGNTGEGA